MHVKVAELFHNQVARAEQGIVFARTSGNYHLFALNLRQLFKIKIMLGLVDWRLGKDPRSIFFSATSHVLEGFPELSKIGSNEDPHADLPLERATIIAYLIDEQIRIDIPTGLDLADRELDRLLSLELISSSFSSLRYDEITTQIDRMQNVTRKKLAACSYRTYFEIIRLWYEGNSIAALVNRAEDLYEKRSDDSFHQGGDQTEGGGRDNGLVVDYRLAAVLKKVGYSGDSIHCWIW